jgi:hypothetical protein
VGGATGGFNPITFAVGARFEATEEKVETLGDYVICTNASEAYIYFQALTSYR